MTTGCSVQVMVREAADCRKDSRSFGKCASGYVGLLALVITGDGKD